MKKSITYILLACVLLLYVISLDCSELLNVKQNTTDKNTASIKPAPLIFQQFLLSAKKNFALNKDVKGLIDTNKKRILLIMEPEAIRRTIEYTIDFIVDKDITVLPQTNSLIDISKEKFILSRKGKTEVFTLEYVVKSEGLSLQNDEMQFISFSLRKMNNASLSADIEGIIDVKQHRVLLVLPHNVITKTTEFIPTFTVTSGVNINPANNTKQNFTIPVTYNLSKESNSTSYVIDLVVIKDSIPTAQDSSLTFNDFMFRKSDNATLLHLRKDIVGIIDNEQRRILLSVPHDVSTQTTRFVPYFTVADGITVQPKSGVEQDFRFPFSYNLKKEASTISYSVEVVVEKDSIAEPEETAVIAFESFIFRRSDNATLLHLRKDIIGIIDNEQRRILLSVPHDVSTQTTRFVPYFTVADGITVQPKSGVEQDFRFPFSYNLEKEASTISYSVEIVVEKDSIAEPEETAVIAFESFMFRKSDNLHMNKELSDVKGIIDNDNKRVTLKVSADTFSTSTIFTPIFTVTEKVTSDIVSKQRKDFVKPVYYTLTMDGTDQIYRVEVVIDSSSVNTKIPYISAFNFEKKKNDHMLKDEITGIVNTIKNEIVIIVKPETYALGSKFIPTITIEHGATVTPAETLKQDFSKPLYYTIKKDGFSQSYLVVIQVAEKIPETIDGTIIKTFNFRMLDNPSISADYEGDIDSKNQTIEVAIPTILYREKYNDRTKLLAIKPYITGNYRILHPDISKGLTLNISKQQEIIITHDDGEIKKYTVNITLIKSNEAILKSIIFEKAKNAHMKNEVSNIEGIIDHDKGIVQFEIGQSSYEANKMFFSTISYSSGASITPSATTPMDFSEQVRIVITSESGTHTKGYKVKISIRKNSITQLKDVDFILFREGNYGTIYDVSEQNKIVKKKGDSRYEVALVPHEYEFLKQQKFRFLFHTGFNSKIIKPKLYKSLPADYTIEPQDKSHQKTITITIVPLPFPTQIKVKVDDDRVATISKSYEDVEYVYDYDLFNGRIVVPIIPTKETSLYITFDDFSDANRNPYGFRTTLNKTNATVTVTKRSEITYDIRSSSASTAPSVLGTLTIEGNGYSKDFTVFTQRRPGNRLIKTEARSEWLKNIVVVSKSPSHSILTYDEFKAIVGTNAVNKVAYHTYEDTLKIVIESNGYQELDVFNKDSFLNKKTLKGSLIMKTRIESQSLEGNYCKPDSDFYYDESKYGTYIYREQAIEKFLYANYLQRYSMPINYSGNIINYIYNFLFGTEESAYEELIHEKNVCEYSYGQQYADYDSLKKSQREWNILTRYNKFIINYKKSMKSHVSVFQEAYK